MQLKTRLISFFLITLFFSIFFKGTVFAADFKVTGTAVDTKNNPVVNAKITVTDVLTQQVIVSTTADHNGYYTLSIPKGTYNITTAPPLGTGLQPTTYSHIAVSSDMKLHSSLNTVGNASSANSGVSVQSLGAKTKSVTTALVVLFIIILLIVCVGLFMWKKKK